MASSSRSRAADIHSASRCSFSDSGDGCNELPSVISGDCQLGGPDPKAYGQIENTIGDDRHVGASLTVYGLGDGLRVCLVHGDCLDAIGDGRGRAGGGGVGAWLDWTAWVDGGALGSAIQVSGN